MAANPYQQMDPASFPDPDAPGAEYNPYNTEGLTDSQLKSPAGVRYTQAEQSLNDLRKQYAGVEGAQSQAYGEQKKLIDNAITKLSSMSFSPNASEQEALMGAAATAPQNGQGNAGTINNEAMTAARIQEALRSGAISKQQLLQQYGEQGIQALIGGTNSMLGKLTQQMRIGQSDVNSAATQLSRQNAQQTKDINAPVVIGANGQPVINQAKVAATQAASAATQAGKLLGLTGNPFHDVTTAITHPGASVGANGVVDPKTNPLYSAFGIQAENYLTTGKAPPGISRNPAMSIAFYRLVSEIAQSRGETPQSVAAEQMANSALSDSYKQLSKTFNNVEAFEGTVRKNIDGVQSVFDQVGNGGVPIFNAWKQAIARGTGFGPSQSALAKLNVYVTDIVDEYAKVMSSANASGGGTSDAARAQAMTVLNRAMTPQAFQAALQGLMATMQNRTDAYQQQLDLMKSHMGRFTPSSGNLPTVTSQAQYDALKAGEKYLGPDGKTYTKAAK